MQLRQLRQAPGRYREDDISDLPPNPTTVEPTVPFDPTLRPAAFPTLELHQFYTEPIQDTEPDTDIQSPERPAVIFRDSRIHEEPIMSGQYDDPGEFQPRTGEEVEGHPAEGLMVSRY